MDYLKTGSGIIEATMGLELYFHQSGFEQRLLDLVKLRASQINGCAYCIDMHWKDLRGRRDRATAVWTGRAWEESPYYSDRGGRRFARLS